MDAVAIEQQKQRYSDGTISEIVIWEVPEPIPGSKHLYKYRLYFGRPGKRLIGYDNERGKGDHRHYEDVEEAYDFRGIEQLRADFEADVQRWRSAASEPDGQH